MRLGIKQQSRDANGAVGSELVDHASVFPSVACEEGKKVMAASEEARGLSLRVEMSKSALRNGGDLDWGK